MVKSIVGSILHGGPTEPFLVPASNKGYGMCRLWDGAYKSTLTANQRVAHVEAATGFLSWYLNSLLPYVRCRITINEMC